MKRIDRRKFFTVAQCCVNEVINTAALKLRFVAAVSKDDFMENECLRILFASSVVLENEPVSLLIRFNK